MVVAPTSLAAVLTMAARREETSTDLQQACPVTARCERSPVGVAQPTNVAIATRNPIRTIRLMQRDSAVMFANVA
jgi:hypothetical protein